MTHCDLYPAVSLSPPMVRLMLYTGPGSERRLVITREARIVGRALWVSVQPVRSPDHVRISARTDELHPLTGSMGGAG